jgi:serine phosphatase RsbU (regulator of sigma subunit)
MGAVDSAHFESMTVELQSGDCVLFHTDGLDALLCDHGRRGVHATIAATPWFTQLEGRTCDAILADLHDRLDATRPEDWPADDVTVIALCVK